MCTRVPGTCGNVYNVVILVTRILIYCVIVYTVPGTLPGTSSLIYYIISLVPFGTVGYSTRYTFLFCVPGTVRYRTVPYLNQSHQPMRRGTGTRHQVLRAEAPTKETWQPHSPLPLLPQRHGISNAPYPASMGCSGNFRLRVERSDPTCVLIFGRSLAFASRSRM